MVYFRRCPCSEQDYNADTPRGFVEFEIDACNLHHSTIHPPLAKPVSVCMLHSSQFAFRSYMLAFFIVTITLYMYTTKFAVSNVECTNPTSQQAIRSNKNDTPQGGVHCNGCRWLFVIIYREFGHASVKFPWCTLVCT